MGLEFHQLFVKHRAHLCKKTQTLRCLWQKDCPKLCVLFKEDTRETLAPEVQACDHLLTQRDL